MKHIHLLFLFFLLMVGLRAQTQETANSSIPENEREITVFMNKFYQALEDAQNTGIGEPAMQMIDKSYTSTRHILDVDGRLTKAIISINDYRTQMNSQMSMKGLKIKFKIESFHFVKVYENVATVNFSLGIYATYFDEPILSYKSFLTDYLKKDDQGNWKIFESNGINVYKQQEIGLCPCTILQSTKNKDEYAVKLLAPSGTSFKEDNLVFTFKNGDGHTVVMVSDNAYMIKANEVTCVKWEGKTVVQKVGLASAPLEVINLILSKSLYMNKCLGFKEMDKQ